MTQNMCGIDFNKSLLIVPLALLGSYSLLIPEFRFAVFGVDTESAFGILAQNSKK
ncbi:hypothetical protein FHS59_000310 [Algoriphagus iocasae]|uniref:Uncharacterized protein n=1 Tax=Algoriphagus iocasae TaxID=1836499 RepID=A0A841MQ61_9BACT|nr:hypothetical protein [Algoriphagus iocasae]